MSEHDFKLNVDSLIERLLEGECISLLLCPIHLFTPIILHFCSLPTITENKTKQKSNGKNSNKCTHTHTYIVVGDVMGSEILCIFCFSIQCINKTKLSENKQSIHFISCFVNFSIGLFEINK